MSSITTMRSQAWWWSVMFHTLKPFFAQILKKSFGVRVVLTTRSDKPLKIAYSRTQLPPSLVLAFIRFQPLEFPSRVFPPDLLFRYRVEFYRLDGRDFFFVEKVSSPSWDLTTDNNWVRSKYYCVPHDHYFYLVYKIPFWESWRIQKITVILNCPLQNWYEFPVKI